MATNGEEEEEDIQVITANGEMSDLSVKVNFELENGVAYQQPTTNRDTVTLSARQTEREGGGEEEQEKEEDIWAVRETVFEDEEEQESCTDEEETTALVTFTGDKEDEEEEGREEDEEERRRREEGKKKKSGILGASFNFTNSIIGAGIIGIPTAIRLAGFIPGVLLLIIVAMVTNYTVLLLIKNGIISNKTSYQEMITAAFGRPGFWILTITQFFFPFLATAGYVVIVGDTFSRIVEELFVIAGTEPLSWAINTSLIKTVTILLVMLPLSLLRNIAMLEKFSALAVLFVTIIVIFTVAKAATYFCSVRCLLPSCCNTPVSIWVINTHFIESVGIMAFAFVCHHNTYLIYGSLSRKSYTRFSKVSYLSVSTSAVFCAVLGLAGFLTFMNDTRGDLLNNYCVDDWAATAARFLYACVIMLTFPIEIFVCREVLEIMLSRLPYKVISWICHSGVKQGVNKFLFSPRHTSLPRHIILTLLLVFFSLAVGLTTDDLGVVLGFNGCLMATPMAFILPTAAYLKLTWRNGRGYWYSPRRLIAWVVMVFGVVVMVIGTALSIQQAVESFSNTATSSLPYCISSSSSTISTCCNLLLGNDSTTQNYTVRHVSMCDCSSFCHNTSILLSPHLYC